jgi:type VI secretion system protein VasD
MRTNARFFVGMIFLLLLIQITACGGKKQVRLNVAISAASNLNPDPSGNPLSVVVRIYQLKDSGRFERADYDALWKNEKETLADDLIQQIERVIHPGSQEIVDVQANPAAGFIGVLALFRNPSGDSWRKVVPVRSKVKGVSVTLHDYVVEIIPNTK